MQEPRFVPLPPKEPVPDEDLRRCADDLRDRLASRRSVRSFSDRPVPREVIEACIEAAGTAPSGANQQPWTFVAISDPTLKRAIREGAEIEEREFYAHRAPPEWLEALAPLGTNPEKPFLVTAPWLVAIFVQRFGRDAGGARVKHYYPTESVGIATGFLVAALHLAGLATLTHTPSPMAFLNSLLGRPDNEKPFLLLVVGHPAPDALVPDIRRKPLAEIASFA